MAHNDNWIEPEELAQYREAVKGYLQGDLDEDRFQAIRLQQGVYGQRQEGVNMVRVKLPGGYVSAEQLGVVAGLLADYSREDIASVTTRQDLQLHSIPLADTPQVLEEMAAQGLTSREACGNTVRNITACPLAGVCPAEHTDVQPVVDAVAARFLRHPLTQHLPRKFKMSFSGCESDCAQGLFHDLAVVAVRRDGKFGYKVLAAGGLGHKPRPAIVLEEFIEEQDLLPVIEAVLALHHRYSDRKRRARARLKFLLEKLGEEEFIQRYQTELQRTRVAYADESLPPAQWVEARDTSVGTTGAPREVLEQKQANKYVFPVSLPLGDLSVAQLRGIATLLLKRDLHDVRVTQDQNLMLLNIPAAELEAVRNELAALGLDSPCVGDDVVACPGTWTCRLGITASRLVCDELSGGVDDLRIRVSGCHNGCAQPYVGDIGLHGEGRRKHGKLIPHYRLHFGGDGRAGGAIAVRGPEVPASRAPQAVRRIKQAFQELRGENESFFSWAQRQGSEYFQELLGDLQEIRELDVPSLLKDFGETQDFRVLALGGGECMGAAQETVSANFSEAAHEREYRRVFLLAKKYDQALGCVEAVARLVGHSMLDAAGDSSQPQELEAIAESLLEAYPDKPFLAESLKGFTSDLARLQKDFDEAAFQRLSEMQDVWVVLAADACRDVDSQLDLQAFLPDIAQLAKAV